jgi:hypothetical protein
LVRLFFFRLLPELGANLCCAALVSHQDLSCGFALGDNCMRETTEIFF